MRVLMGQPSFSDCERMRSVISASLDGEVSEVEQATADAHLAECGACRAYAASLAETARLLQSDRAVAAPPRCRFVPSLPTAENQ